MHTLTHNHTHAPHLHNNYACTYILNLAFLLPIIQLYDEAKDTMAKEREERVSLVDKISKLENHLKEKGRTIGELINQ